MLEDRAVVAPTEVFGLHDARDGVEGRIVHHEAAQNGLFARNALGRTPQSGRFVLNVGHESMR